MDQIYLDYNATTPLDPSVLESMLPFLERHFGNPSSGHALGLKAKRALEEARAKVAAMIGADSAEIVFTSGGTEANNFAIRGAAAARKHKGNHIITSAVEHPAVTQVCRRLESRGFRLTTVGVDRFGAVDPSDIEKAITQETVLVTVMHANNEVGTIQPIRDIAAIAHRCGALFHSDAAQSVGKIPVDVAELGVDMLSIAGHKIYAPKGVGALFVRNGVTLENLMAGADHEDGRRPGTENVPSIVGLGRACDIIAHDGAERGVHQRAMRDRLERLLSDTIPDIKVNGHPDHRLPNTLSVGFGGLAAEAILERLDEIAASAGAACHSGGVRVSSTLEAMRVPPEYARATVRFSTGTLVTMPQIDRAAAAVARAVETLRGENETGC